MTDFGKFDLKACFGGWGFGKKIESRRGAATDFTGGFGLVLAAERGILVEIQIFF